VVAGVDLQVKEARAFSPDGVPGLLSADKVHKGP
jgi:hypothetical protein